MSEVDKAQDKTNNQSLNQGRRVLVTGASGGIGGAIATTLAEAGFSLALHYHSNEAAVQQLLQTLAQPASASSHTTLQFSSSEREACQQAINADIEANGAYYGVVCNAGIIRDAAFPAMTGDEWDSVLRTNLDGFFNVVQPTIMPMVRAKKGGRIVTISSVSGMMGNRGQTNYSAAKGGLIAASKSLALELAKRKITVNCVAPGIIDTEMAESFDTEVINNIVPLRRAGTAKEVASLVNYLFADEAAYITRQVIAVNGGMF